MHTFVSTSPPLDQSLIQIALRCPHHCWLGRQSHHHSIHSFVVMEQQFGDIYHYEIQGGRLVTQMRLVEYAVASLHQGFEPVQTTANIQLTVEHLY